MIERRGHLEAVRGLLRQFPVVALLGARQVGKSTLAREVARLARGPTTFFDLEHEPDLRALTFPARTLEPLKGLVVLDEVQRRPELFPALRVLADRPKGARFLVLGSAARSCANRRRRSPGESAFMLPALGAQRFVGKRSTDCGCAEGSALYTGVPAQRDLAAELRADVHRA